MREVKGLKYILNAQSNIFLHSPLPLFGPSLPLPKVS